MGTLKPPQHINANAIDAEVASAVENIDAEYAELCNTFALVNA